MSSLIKDIRQVNRNGVLVLQVWPQQPVEEYDWAYGRWVDVRVEKENIGNIQIVEADRAERNLPNYHEILEPICKEFDLLGSPTLHEALDRIREKCREAA